jgi:hypothetical protein
MEEPWEKPPSGAGEGTPDAPRAASGPGAPQPVEPYLWPEERVTGIDEAEGPVTDMADDDRTPSEAISAPEAAASETVPETEGREET